MSTEPVTVTETHTAHLDYVDATVTISREGEARLTLTDPEDNEIRLDGDDLAAINAIWERATRAND